MCKIIWFVFLHLINFSYLIWSQLFISLRFNFTLLHSDIWRQHPQLRFILFVKVTIFTIIITLPVLLATFSHIIFRTVYSRSYIDDELQHIFPLLVFPDVTEGILVLWTCISRNCHAVLIGLLHCIFLRTVQKERDDSQMNY